MALLFAGEATCGQPAWTACAGRHDGPARETCIPTCQAIYDKEAHLRPYEICYMSCEVEAGTFGCACGAANGCPLAGSGGTKSFCMTNCTADYVSCLRGMDSDNLADVAERRPDYFSCIGGC